MQVYPVPRAPAGDPITAAQALENAPGTVRDSNPADSCGEFVLDQGESLPTDAVDCLSDARDANAKAELAWTYPTTEGDPIVYFAFTSGDGFVVFSTNEFDSYGGNFGWSQSSCTDVDAAVSTMGCPTP